MKIRIGKAKRLNRHTIWYAAVDKEMTTHLSPQQVKELCNTLSDLVNSVGKQYKVGREYKHGQLQEENWS